MLNETYKTNYQSSAKMISTIVVRVLLKTLDNKDAFITPSSFIPSNTPTHEASEVSRGVQPDCYREETFLTFCPETLY